MQITDDQGLLTAEAAGDFAEWARYCPWVTRAVALKVDGVWHVEWTGVTGRFRARMDRTLKAWARIFSEPRITPAESYARLLTESRATPSPTRTHSRPAPSSIASADFPTTKQRP